MSGRARNATENCGETFEKSFSVSVAGSCWKNGSTKYVARVALRFSWSKRAPTVASTRPNVNVPLPYRPTPVSSSAACGLYWCTSTGMNGEIRPGAYVLIAL